MDQLTKRAVHHQFFFLKGKTRIYVCYKASRVGRIPVCANVRGWVPCGCGVPVHYVHLVCVYAIRHWLDPFGWVQTGSRSPRRRAKPNNPVCCTPCCPLNSRFRWGPSRKYIELIIEDVLRAFVHFALDVRSRALNCTGIHVVRARDLYGLRTNVGGGERLRTDE